MLVAEIWVYIKVKYNVSLIRIVCVNYQWFNTFVTHSETQMLNMFPVTFVLTT